MGKKKKQREEMIQNQHSDYTKPAVQVVLYLNQLPLCPKVELYIFFQTPVLVLLDSLQLL